MTGHGNAAKGAPSGAPAARQGCPEHPDGSHTWKGTGLDTVDDTLMTTRRCLRCGVEQVKPYGAGSRRAWRTVRGAS